MMKMQYIVDGNKTLLTIIFNKFILDKLQAKVDDYLFFFQSNFNLYSFTIGKSDTGYRITRYPGKKKTYQINIGHKINGLNEFEYIDCICFIKKSGLIKIKIKD